MSRTSAEYVSWRYKILGGKEIATLDDDFVAEAQAEVRLSHIEAEQRANVIAIEQLEKLIKDDLAEMERVRDRCRQRMTILAGERAKAKIVNAYVPTPSQVSQADSVLEQGAQQIAAE